MGEKLSIIRPTLVRGEIANWGGANMRVMRGGHFWQLGSIASLALQVGDSSTISQSPQF